MKSRATGQKNKENTAPLGLTHRNTKMLNSIQGIQWLLTSVLLS